VSGKDFRRCQDRFSAVLPPRRAADDINGFSRLGAIAYFDDDDDDDIPSHPIVAFAVDEELGLCYS
jgi:hypothetical protein